MTAAAAARLGGATHLFGRHFFLVFLPDGPQRVELFNDGPHVRFDERELVLVFTVNFSLKGVRVWSGQILIPFC